MMASEFWNQLCQIQVGAISRDHWNAVVSILIEKPQSVDKRAAGQVNAHENHHEKSKIDINLSKLSSEYCTGERTDERKILFQKLITRKPKKFCDWYRVVIQEAFSVVFIPVTSEAIEDTSTTVAYKISYLDKPDDYQENQHNLVLEVRPGLGVKQEHWLTSLLWTTIQKWLKDEIIGSASSLRLVDLEKYCSEYERLKNKYAGDLVANWSETSDPEKSVHEDIGIAAYLSCLWGEQKVSFVDLGCGNGLLVFLLNSEGHKGRGLDLRRRKIWSTFPEDIQACLLEQAIVPSLDTSFPGVQWILGNHSDELTPWIPVFACLSGASTQYWVLPCCPFTFTAKYQRKNGSVSVFRDYLDHVTQLGKIAGFQVDEDRMRIPSTKRICLVGTPDQTCQDYETRKKTVLDYVSSQMKNFVPREKVERVRNCTQIGSDIIQAIVKCVVKVCLETENLMQKDFQEDGGSNTSRTWNAGGELTLHTVITHLQADKSIDLSRLKSECGGLQTLLKNNHSIFHVEKGRVKLRVPSSAKPMYAAAKIKRRPCWFHENHPDGCLLQDADCTWIHT
eukprot:TRINITY_DN6703_c0_g1_i3.p1 TRINITY_DN6703_c0_g1~~TRINITY_DN6703_c0_g1_i3.p1  ORF type:complete len:563 (-),score=83.67 TRINITY_DN6703_c0_g1_i3:346-2034(-)